MNLKRYMALAMFFLFCLPTVLLGASSQEYDLTYGFLGDPLPSDVTLYEGAVDFIQEKGGGISINDTLYQLKGTTTYLTSFKSRTSLEYFKPDTTVQFYAHVFDNVIYEIMAVSSPEATSGKQGQPPVENQGTPILEDGVWRN